ncbi:hypothetical protein ACL5HQ_20145 [Stenotrophomonas maltophilia]|uniref:hypothetical protein n=1 Tax=Stenotrophomonas sp. GD04024 TaxID=2975422 RepID=UPI00244A24C8|nr:hypothetical protein [Stenotrophomonas sp. GD04024]MDG9986840.1 hypothetical protein [Stenotrophomonas sp. GD04024]
MSNDKTTLADVQPGGRVRLGSGLLPCPFCGAPAERIDFGIGSGENEGGSCIACTVCQHSGPIEFGFKENFVSNWNRRALSAQTSQGGQTDGCVQVPMQTLESIRDSSSCAHARGFAAGALQTQPSLGGQGDAHGCLAATLGDLFMRGWIDDVSGKLIGEAARKDMAAALAARHPVMAVPQGCDACDRTGIRQNDEGRNICCPDCELGSACAGDTRQPVGDQHPDDLAVDAFAAAMKAKMAAARAKGRGGWEDPAQCTADDLSRMLRDHVDKGDPRDVANFCMMLHQRGESISARQPVGEPVDDDAASEAFAEFADDYLTDGNGYAPASTYEACGHAFKAAWPDRDAAVRAARAELKRLHGDDRTVGARRAEALNRAGTRDDAEDDAARPVLAVDLGPTFQAGVAEWMGQCFLPSLYSNMTERGDRLLEEVLELLQAHGYDIARVPTLVDYVFGRPVGEPAQEVGGVMVTLAGYCWVAGLDMHAAGDAELARISQPEVMAKIRAKQEAKNALHFDTPLPGNAGPTVQAVDPWPVIDRVAKNWDGCSIGAAIRAEAEKLIGKPAQAVDLGQFLPAVRMLVVSARTSGGTAGRDAHLCEALDRVEALLPKLDSQAVGK